MPCVDANEDIVVNVSQLRECRRVEGGWMSSENRWFGLELSYINTPGITTVQYLTDKKKRDEVFEKIRKLMLETDETWRLW